MQFNQTQDNRPPLEQFGRNLIEQVKNGKMDPVIGRDEEIRNVIRILSRKTKNNPVLIGEPGVGKTAIVEGLAYRILNNAVPFVLQGYRVIKINSSSLLGKISYNGKELPPFEEINDFNYKEEANMIIMDAKSSASRIVNEALIKAEEVEMKTRIAARNLKIFKQKLKIRVLSYIQFLYFFHHLLQFYQLKLI